MPLVLKALLLGIYMYITCASLPTESLKTQRVNLLEYLEAYCRHIDVISPANCIQEFCSAI